MDLIGKTVRDFLMTRHTQDLKKASAMVNELRQEGMRRSEIEEMLYSSGFDEYIIRETMESFPKTKKH